MTSAAEPAAESVFGFPPTLRQRQLWHTALCDPPQGGYALVGYGGAMGGGKTRALAELALECAHTYPGAKLLIARLRYTDLRTTTMGEFFAACPDSMIAAHHRTPPEQVVIQARGARGAPSTIHFRHLTDWTGLGSQQYGGVFIDEAGEVSEDAARMLVTRLRHPAQPLRMLVAASNPWPGWFERWFVRRQLPLDRLQEATARLAFVAAKIRDNPWLPGDYEALQRAVLPDDWSDRLIDGSFDSFVGLIYPSFDPLRHRWDEPLPPFARYVGGLDFGGLGPRDHFTAGIVAGLTDRRAWCGPDVLIRLYEFEERGPSAIERLERWMRECARALTGSPRGPIHWRADRSQQAWINHAAHSGLRVTASGGGPGSVVAGIDLVLRRLGSFGSEPPSSYYVPDLARFPKRMAEYLWQPPDPARGTPGRPLKQDDDLMDADRYMHEAAAEYSRRLGQPSSIAITRASSLPPKLRLPLHNPQRSWS